MPQTLAYIGGLQLAVSSGFTSLIAAFCGLIAGLAYRSNLFGIGKFMVRYTPLYRVLIGSISFRAV